MTTTQHSNSFCQAWTGGRWKVVAVEYARVRTGMVVRCLECHGPVVLMQAGRNNTTRAHAEHRPGHTGCSIGHYFNGERSPHPQQVLPPVKAGDHPPEEDIVLEDEESAFPEGREKFGQHRRLERDGRIIRLAKAKRLRETGKLECDVCKFDFASSFGDRGQGYIEAHHTVPVSELRARKTTKVSELALVCSNCHRMLHRGQPLLSVQQLKALRKDA